MLKSHKIDSATRQWVFCSYLMSFEKFQKLMYIDIVINRVRTKSLVDTSATHNFVQVDDVKYLGLKVTNKYGTMKAVNWRLN